MPHLLFTLDFHELVKGKLQPGVPCDIDYDPRRLFPSAIPYRQGDPAWPVTAHISMSPSGQTQDLALESPSGVVDHPIVRLDGQGSMLRGTFSPVVGTAELSVWFSGQSPDGTRYFDSEFEANYHFRFSQLDLRLKEAKVINQPNSPWSRLLIVIEAVSAVEKILIRYRILNSDQPNREIECWAAQTGEHWDAGNARLPFDAVVAFDIVYYVGGRKFKDDNNGNYYLCEKG